MTTARFLMIASEILVGVALIAHMFLPTTFGVSFHVSDRSVGIPIRWFVPLLLISVAGILSTAALLRMGWTLAHVTISKITVATSRLTIIDPVASEIARLRHLSVLDANGT
jgi:hypothetical protein